MIYYAINSTHFETWLSDETILKALEPIRQNLRYVDPDPVFCAANDEDYDLNSGGLVKYSHFNLYLILIILSLVKVLYFSTAIGLNIVC